MLYKILSLMQRKYINSDTKSFASTLFLEIKVLLYHLKKYISNYVQKNQYLDSILQKQIMNSKQEKIVIYSFRCPFAISILKYIRYIHLLEFIYNHEMSRFPFHKNIINLRRKSILDEAIRIIWIKIMKVMLLWILLIKIKGINIKVSIIGNDVSLHIKYNYCTPSTKCWKNYLL